MRSLFQISASFARLSPEQRVLVGGRGADTRAVDEWIELLEPVSRFGQTRRDALRSVMILIAVAAPAVAGLALLDVSRAFGGVSVPASLYALGLLLVIALLAAAAWLRARAVPPDLGLFTLPLLRALADADGGAQLWLTVRCVNQREDDARWLEGALSLDEHTLLHFSARDVLESGALVTWLRATVSEVERVAAHELGEDDPTASGMTRVAAKTAEKTGNPFTSMEMLALKTAHGIQLDLARLEAFGDLAVPPPPVGDVRGEATERTSGGRALASADALVSLWKRAAAGEGGHP